MATMNDDINADAHWMRYALALAQRGEGSVEPNPMVGCVIVHDGVVLGEGYHATFGGPHAEVEAISAASADCLGATLYVTLEPCCHTGKTPPCTDAICAAPLRRVVVATLDPFPSVAGRGVAFLREHGMEVSVGVEEAAAQHLLAPYLTRLVKKRPWVIAKYAMTLDGKIASATGSSRWISSAPSRQRVMELRSRVDAIVIGGETAHRDDPLLTVRFDAESVTPRRTTRRRPVRLVIGRTERVASSSRLFQTARETPLVVVTEAATPSERRRLEDAGAELWLFAETTPKERLHRLLTELAARDATNILVEGGGQLLASLWEERLIDEVYAFIAPKLIGGAAAPTPLAGMGRAAMEDAATFATATWIPSGDDILFRGRLQKS